MNGEQTFEFLKLILQFGIIPLIYGVYRVDNSVRDLKFIIHTDFVKQSALEKTVEALERKIEDLRHELEKKADRKKVA